jgi:hypothetical protein
VPLSLTRRNVRHGALRVIGAGGDPPVVVRLRSCACPHSFLCRRWRIRLAVAPVIGWPSFRLRLRFLLSFPTFMILVFVVSGTISG